LVIGRRRLDDPTNFLTRKLTARPKPVGDGDDGVAMPVYDFFGSRL
jgi:hypothetical protein